MNTDSSGPPAANSALLASANESENRHSYRKHYSADDRDNLNQAMDHNDALEFIAEDLMLYDEVVSANVESIEAQEDRRSKNDPKEMESIYNENAIDLTGAFGLTDDDIMLLDEVVSANVESTEAQEDIDEIDAASCRENRRSWIGNRRILLRQTLKDDVGATYLALYHPEQDEAQQLPSLSYGLPASPDIELGRARIAKTEDAFDEMMEQKSTERLERYDSDLYRRI